MMTGASSSTDPSRFTLPNLHENRATGFLTAGLATSNALAEINPQFFNPQFFKSLIHVFSGTLVMLMLDADLAVNICTHSANHFANNALRLLVELLSCNIGIENSHFREKRCQYCSWKSCNVEFVYCWQQLCRIICRIIC